MGTFEKITGTTEQGFNVGGPAGPQIHREMDDLAVRDAGNTAYARLRYLPAFAMIADLPAPATEPDGRIVLVQSQRAVYMAQPAQARWIRLVAASVGSWFGTTDIYVSAAGSAENDGSAAHPVTPSEAQARRFACDANGRLTSVVTVHLSGAGGDLGEVLWDVPPAQGDGGLFIVGVVTTTGASVITAVTARARATNVPLQLTDAAATWAVGDFLQYNGAASPAISPVKSIAGNVATVGTAVQIAFSVGVGGLTLSAFAEVVPAGQAYSRRVLPTFTNLTLTMTGGDYSSAGGWGCVLQDVRVTGALSVTTTSERGFALNRCSTPSLYMSSNGSGTIWPLNCFVDASGAGPRMRANGNSVGLIAAGAMPNDLEVTDGYVEIDTGALINRIRVEGPALVEILDCGSMAATSFAVTASSGGSVSLLNAAALWGVSTVAGSVTYSVGAFGQIRNRSGTTWALASPQKGALGTAGTTDATLGALNTCNTFNPATGLFSAGGVPLRMVNLDAAAPGGFGGTAVAFGGGFAKA